LSQARLPPPDRRAKLDFMPGSDIPVIRQPFEKGDPLPYWTYGGRPGAHELYDVAEDPDEEHNLAGTPDEKRAIDLLRAALDEVEAPAEQLERLGVS
jgi:arylsulfatase A-like enzyme